MLTKTIHIKGFQLVKLESKHMHKIGSPGICDYCNYEMNAGTFIGALNKIYCDECFQKWENRAVFYDQDRPFETRATDRLLTQINS